MGDWVGIFITLISLFFGGFVLGVKWGEGKPLLDIKEYLKQTKTVLVTQDAFDELVKKASAQPERKTGRWIDDNCSECGQYVYHGDARNFCPNCGADMREGESCEK